MSTYTPLDDDLSLHGNIISVELFSAIATNLNHLITCVKPGKVVMVLTGLAGVPTPDPEYWQLCDGSAITNVNSPLRGGTTPNYTDVGRYLRAYDTIGQVGTYDGYNTKTLSHDHGGATGGQSSTEQCDNDSDEYFSSVDHTHTISSDLGTAINFEPAHVRIAHYIKIN